MWHARDIVKDPIEYALKQVMKEIGQLLFDALGSTNALREVADRICDRDPSKWGRRASPIDSAFNGVGRGKDRWWS